MQPVAVGLAKVLALRMLAVLWVTFLTPCGLTLSHGVAGEQVNWIHTSYTTQKDIYDIKRWNRMDE